MRIFDEEADQLARTIAFDGLDFGDDGLQLMQLIQHIDDVLSTSVDEAIRRQLLFGMLLAYNGQIPWNTTPLANETADAREKREAAVLWQFVYIFFLGKKLGWRV